LTLSLILPVHNEEQMLLASVTLLEQHLGTLLPGTGDFEIILVCNGCTDKSEVVAQELVRRYSPRVHALSFERRGLGVAMREGMAAARHEFLMFYAIDLPFGLSIIDDSLAAAREEPQRLVIGSKGHPNSRLTRSSGRSWIPQRPCTVPG